MSADERVPPEELSRRRGYELEMHRIMAAADPEWLQRYGAFVEATYTGPRLLDRKTKECPARGRRSDPRPRPRGGGSEGATPREILEALQAVIVPMGGLAFRRGVQAWAAETGFESGGEGHGKR